MLPLPIDALIPEILGCLRSSGNVVVEAPPGAGKTTRVPPALLAAGGGEILVLEPRRLATRLAARRVAFERGERLGQTVGYQVRFEEVAGPHTRLRFMTEGVLTRRLLSDPRLDGVAAVVLDEFHERHLEGDLCLALLRRLQKMARPDLRLVVMSATMEAAPICAFLGDCPLVRSTGRQFETSIRYTPVSAEALEQQVAGALEKLVREGLDGDVLVFLPGAAEIRRAMRACQGMAERWNLLLLPLHGDLSAEEQDRAVLPAERRKVILSTNVAESSVTIEGVTAVIDSGLARMASQSPWSGLPVLRVTRISKASANQRAGRAGRTGPGRAIRLYPAEDFQRRPAQELPEIERGELSQVVLTLGALGVAGASELEWLESPPATALESAAELLRRLGAVDHAGALTEMGRRMARLPLHPRLARLVFEAEGRGASEDGCALAALLSSGERLPVGTDRSGPSDLLLLLDSDWEPRTRQLFQQIRRAARVGRQAGNTEQALLLAILTAFPDRVARQRESGELLLATGGSARLSSDSVVRTHEFLVAVDIEERSEHGVPLVRLASGIEPEWLLELHAERVSERSQIEWNRTAERVERSNALLYDSLVIQESRSAAPAGEETSRLLVERALEAGLGRFVDVEALDQYLARAAFASEHSSLPQLGEEDARAALASLCQGLRSFAEVEAAARAGGVWRALERRLPAGGARRLKECAPERLRLPSGRSVRVHYARGQTPWIAARLQEFFGIQKTPRVAGGTVPVVVHLLAPNNRPVQMTTDLAGFWQRLYPQVRRELSRRYPRHAWPEKPAASR
jgi:ATP-dependent helicase HrpB